MLRRPTISVAACLALAACRDEGTGAVPAGASGAAVEKPNVLVLTLDTTRWDRLGCYGHAAAQTPALDQLAARGTRFERAYAPVPLTLPTHATLWTGLQPPEHGIHDNGRSALGADVPHLAAALRDKGWSTGAFLSSAVLDSAFGLARGFDTYDDRMSAVDAGGDAEPPQRTGDKTTDAAVEWLRAAPEPFLAWVHFYDPHSTYEPPSPWKEQLKDPYDGEIAFMDAQIARILAALQARGTLERTVVVAVADHGESLGEHGESTHGIFVYDATLRIPLIVSAPGFAPRVATTPVQVADVAPTILDLCRQPRMGSGRSLVPALRGEKLATVPIYGESEYSWLSFGWSPLHTVLHDGWRTIQSSDPELYDQARDPRELVDMARDEPERLARHLGVLADLRAEFRAHGTSAAAVDEELANRLSSLGYAQSSDGASGALPADLKSPRAMLSVYEDFTRGVGFAQHGQAERGIPLLQRAVEAWPRGAQIRLQLGMALHMAARHADARAELGRALEIDASLDQAHYFTGLAHAAEGAYDEAVAAFDRAMALKPDAYMPLASKAWALVRLGREDDAIACMQTVVQRKPKYVNHALSLAQLLRSRGRAAEAIAVLSAAHAQRPGEAGLALYLAWELATNPDDAARDGKRAVALAEAAVRARGRAPDDLDTLAAAYAEAGRFEEAVATVEEALKTAGPHADAALIAEWSARLERYRARQPHRDG